MNREMGRNRKRKIESSVENLTLGSEWWIG